MSAVFVHDDAQKKEATLSKEARQKTGGRKLETPILQINDFYVAEDYHQKYLLQQQLALTKYFPKSPFQDFVDSTPASRVNGYLSGYGKLDNLMSEIDSFGLPQSARDDLIRMVRSRAKN